MNFQYFSTNKYKYKVVHFLVILLEIIKKKDIKIEKKREKVKTFSIKNIKLKIV